MFDAIVAYRDDSDLRDAVNVAQRTVSYISSREADKYSHYSSWFHLLSQLLNCSHFLIVICSLECGVPAYFHAR